jgi:HAD superfamily hydrolase (TIGR01509 family)
MPHMLPRALLFDMDGTITRPLLDFPRIKEEMGIGDRPILEGLAALSGPDRERAEAVLHRHEEEAAGRSSLNDGCERLLNFAAAHRIRTALITRNSRRSVETVIGLHRLEFEVLVTREDGRHKPHPDPLHLALRRLGVAPQDAWMVGDGEYDVEAGLAAGVKTVWISHGQEKPFAAEPSHAVRDLIELTALLRQCLPRQGSV